MAIATFTLQINTPENLTQRELAVAALVAQALTDREIAKRLYISHGSVRSHVNSLMGKLGLRNRVSICRWWLISFYEAEKTVKFNK